MDFLKFEDVSFAYPPVEGDVDQDGKQIQPPAIFDHFSAQLPGGFVSLVGPNGSGKSTLMLLAAGRVLPNAGGVLLLGQDTRALNQDSRDKLASYIYQNMELDTDETTGALLDYVYQNGSLGGAAAGVVDPSKDFLSEIKEVFEVADLTDKKLTALSKGQLQRALVCFALLYGSKSIFMDEPFFAMEESQKESALKYLKAYCAATKIPVYISMHELDLTKKYADTVMLFYPNHDIDLGTADEVLTNEALEKSYGVPASMLKQSEELSREQIARRGWV